jgi:hypothetical protein
VPLAPISVIGHAKPLPWWKAFDLPMTAMSAITRDSGDPGDLLASAVRGSCDVAVFMYQFGH